VVGAPPEIQRVIEYIDAHLDEEISISLLGEIAGYSPWHLCHLFTDHIGMPVMEYVRSRRLHLAADELPHGRRLYDIALDYGFETQAGFYKAFQRHFGCSPTEYRIHELRGINSQISPALLEVAKGGNMQDRLIIRVVQEADAGDLWENIYSQNTPNEVKDRIALYLQAYAEEKAVPLVAEVEGHVIGVTHIAFDEHPLRAHICTLHDVVVNPAFHGMGIARRLIEECRTRAVEKGKRMICVSCRGGTAAETVYGKLGFTECGRLPNGLIEPWGEHDAYDEVFLYMQLSEIE
jgi:AraC-like DNA-binding protein/predicted N-acetyltransferase YhbS